MKGLLCRTLEVVRSSWQFYKCAEGVPGLSLSFSLSLSLFLSLHFTSLRRGEVHRSWTRAKAPASQLSGGSSFGVVVGWGCFPPRSERFEACVRRGPALPIHSFSLSLSLSPSLCLSLSLSLSLYMYIYIYICHLSDISLYPSSLSCLSLSLSLSLALALFVVELSACVYMCIV